MPFRGRGHAHPPAPGSGRRASGHVRVKFWPEHSNRKVSVPGDAGLQRRSARVVTLLGCV